MARHKIRCQASYQVRLLAPALVDLNAVIEYYHQAVGSAAAQKVIDALFSSLKWLELFPLAFPLAPDKELTQQRYRILPGGDCFCLYKLVGKEVFVYHIAATVVDYPALFA